MGHTHPHPAPYFLPLSFPDCEVHVPHLGTRLALTVASHPLSLCSEQRRFQATEAALSSSQEEVVCLRQKTEAQVTLLAEQGDWLYGLEMERRRLHNQLQELKGNIRVFCHVRPILTGESTPSPGFLVFPPGPVGPSDPPTCLNLSQSDRKSVV